MEKENKKKESSGTNRESAFKKDVHVSDALAKIVGNNPMPRTEVTKKVWDYIKLHNLQDKKDGRAINPDSLLAAVLGGPEQINMFQLTKKISLHIKSK